MRSAQCEACEAETPLNTLFRVNDKRLCEPCGNQELSELKSQNVQWTVAREVDPTVCARCNVDFGNEILPVVLNAPVCAACTQIIYARPFPTWLKASFAGLTIALVFAIIHALPFFKAGRDYVRAERMLAAGHYHDAIPGLEKAVAAGPDATEIRLQLANAYLKDGDFDKAYALVKGRSFPKSALFDQVELTFGRFDKAGKKIEEASKLAEGHAAEAAKLMREAADLVPEVPAVRDGAETLEAGAAFERKDYEGFEQLSQKMWEAKHDSTSAAMLASAIACRYAISGDNATRLRAEEMMNTARDLAATDEERAGLEEYTPRIQHRLASREIIDRKEYNRRYRPELVEESH